VHELTVLCSIVDACSSNPTHRGLLLHHVASQAYLGLLRDMVSIVQQLQEPVCSEKLCEKMQTDIDAFVERYTTYTSSVVSGVHCVPANHSYLSNARFMKLHMLRHAPLSKLLYGPAWEYSTGACLCRWLLPRSVYANL
jgi:hypothetical protein